MPRLRAGQQGFALVAVLWVAGILATIAMAVATSARMKGVQAMNAQKSVEIGYLLDSALAVARFEYKKYQYNSNLLDDKETVELLTGEELDIKYPRYEPYTVEVNGAQVQIRMISENGKFNVNTVSTDTMRKILQTCGVEAGSATTAIVNSISDWQDTDNNHRSDGAENDYYEDLDTPYLCKNAPLENLEELLLIKGVTPELYSGTDELPGLKDLLSVNGMKDAIDVNSAAPAAFAMVEGLPLAVIEDIIELRNEKPIENMSDLNDVIPFQYMSQFSSLFKVFPVSTLRLEATYHGRTVSSTFN